MAAGDLIIGDEVYLDGSKAVVTGSELERLVEPIKVYNLEVQDYHTYFVGDVPVLVHNYITEEDLYAWESPYELDGKPAGGRPRDFKGAKTRNDIVGPYTQDNPEGASSFSNYKEGIKKGLKGNYYKLPKGTELPDDIGVKPDGNGTSHNTFYPTREMTIKEFNSIFKNLGWEYYGKS